MNGLIDGWMNWQIDNAVRRDRDTENKLSILDQQGQSWNKHCFSRNVRKKSVASGGCWGVHRRIFKLLKKTATTEIKDTKPQKGK